MTIDKLSPASTILHSLAIAVAVNLLSPVTILTFIPAFLHSNTAFGTSYLNTSLIPNKHNNVKPLLSILYTPLLSVYPGSLSVPISKYATAMVLNAKLAIFSIASSICL
jgi:hypothetical protein